MTQALINSLNIIPEKSVNLADKASKVTGMDFSKIFERKTDSFKQDNNKQSKLKTADSNSEQSASLNKKITERKNNNLQASQSKNGTKLQTAIQNAVSESEAEDASELNIEITDTHNSEETTISEITNAEEDLNILEEIITEEDPTMYNELNSLEDSTSLLLLQAQIQQTIKSARENEQTVNTNENSDIQTMNQSLDSKNHATAIFKQFDNTDLKNTNITNTVQNLTPKEHSNIKSEHSKASHTINETIVKELNVEAVNSQSSNAESSMGDLMQNQSPQEQAARVMIQGDLKFEQTVGEAIKNTTQTHTTEITPSKIIEQISKQLDGMVNNSKLNMVLNPGFLGKVNLQIMNTKEGLTAMFSVTTQDAKDIIMKGLDGLKESLLAQGINVDNITIKLEESEGDYKFDYTEQEGSKGGNKQQQGTKKQKENEKQFEQMMFELENEVNV